MFLRGSGPAMTRSPRRQRSPLSIPPFCCRLQSIIPRPSVAQIGIELVPSPGGCRIVFGPRLFEAEEPRQHALGLRHRAFALRRPSLVAVCFADIVELNDPILDRRVFRALPSPPLPFRHLPIREHDPRGGTRQDVGKGDDEEAGNEGGREERRGHSRPRVEMRRWHDVGSSDGGSRGKQEEALRQLVNGERSRTIGASQLTNAYPGTRQTMVRPEARMDLVVGEVEIPKEAGGGVGRVWMSRRQSRVDAERAPIIEPSSKFFGAERWGHLGHRSTGCRAWPRLGMKNGPGSRPHPRA